MADKTEAWIKRANEILGQQRGSEAVQSAISMLTALYGSQSTQLKGFIAGLEMISKTAPNPTNADHHHLLLAHGAIRNAKAELEAGLIVSLRVLVAGEILSELVRLGKEILEEQTEAAKNVAAVLISAAFEDLMRRMGEEFAGVTDRPKLEGVITALKNAEVLKGGQVALATSFLPFRNHSLHAAWEKVDRSQVQACIALIDGLLMKHFS